MSYPPPHPNSGFAHLSMPYAPAVSAEQGEYYVHPQQDAVLPQSQAHVQAQQAQMQRAQQVQQPQQVQAQAQRQAGPSRQRTRRSRASVSASTDTQEEEADGTPVRKKIRVTLPRGHACVSCRKCQEGVRPCSTCIKSGMECRNEELPRKKSRAAALEERVAELEALIEMTTGKPAPPPADEAAIVSKEVASAYAANSVTPPEPQSRTTTTTSTGEYPSDAPSSGLVVPFMGSSVSGPVPIEIPPHSALEQALVRFILPYTPFLHIPLHPQRFLALISLPAQDPARPHPALLYILFYEAITHLENQIPLPRAPQPPLSLFLLPTTPPLPAPAIDSLTLLSTLGGTAPSLLERARLELDSGIRHVDRPFDLVRAAVGIARALSAEGKFMEAWAVPVAQLVVSCGLHRVSGNYIPPDGEPGDNRAMPKAYAPAYHYPNSHSHTAPSPGNSREQGVEARDSSTTVAPLRMRPVILPPARDGIEVAERVMAFWAAKMVCWQNSTGWGWVDPLADEQCTTEWGWGWGHVEVKPMNLASERYALKDLYDPSSGMHMSPNADSTYVLAVKSTALLARASSLYDLAEASYPVTLSDGRIAPPHIAPLSTIESTQSALHLFRGTIPPALSFPAPAHSLPGHPHSHLHPNPHGLPQGHPAHPTPLPSPSELSPHSGERYDGPADPWWILLHANLNAAEMLAWREMANLRGEVSRDALRSASMLVNLVRAVPDDCWANVDILVAQALSLASRLLTKEAASLHLSGQAQSAARMDADSELLRRCLEGPFDRFVKMAGVHSRIVQRVREGWTDKEGEYERV
ncbi:hypothetical protein IAT38_004894 [Cryptococcus sp. DSM 104549]